MESNHKLLIKYVTARYLSQNIPSNIKDLDITYVKKVHPEFAKVLRYLDDYVDNYYDTDKFSFRYDSFKHLENLCQKEGLLEDKALKKLNLAEAYFDKYPLIQYISIPNDVAAEEFKCYMEAKGAVNPLLLQRLKEFKQQKQD